MKVWDVTISGHNGTKYHKGILLEDFKDFIKELKNELSPEKFNNKRDVFLSIDETIDAVVGEGVA